MSRFTALVLVGLMLLGACARQMAPAGSSVVPTGVELEVEPAVEFTQTTVSDSSGVQSSDATIEGKPLIFNAGEMHIGEASFGALKSGDKVRVADDGVYVNEQHRGALP